MAGFTIEQVCKVFNLKEETVREWLNKGEDLPEQALNEGIRLTEETIKSLLSTQGIRYDRALLLRVTGEVARARLGSLFGAVTGLAPVLGAAGDILTKMKQAQAAGPAADENIVSEAARAQEDKTTGEAAPTPGRDSASEAAQMPCEKFVGEAAPTQGKETPVEAAPAPGKEAPDQPVDPV